jgi:hypothetical protein
VGFRASLCCLQTTDESRFVDVIREDALAVDLDHRQPLAILRLQGRIAPDVDLPELERVLGANGREHRPSPLAELAPRSDEERDAGYG